MCLHLHQLLTTEDTKMLYLREWTVLVLPAPSGPSITILNLLAAFFPLLKAC